MNEGSTKREPSVGADEEGTIADDEKTTKRDSLPAKGEAFHSVRPPTTNPEIQVN